MILIGLNELNFDYIKFYTQKELLPNFKLLFDKHQLIETESEANYDLLEHWIQWVTIYTGKKYKDHKIFRLGDIVEAKKLEQFFEVIEKKGFTVGAVSPFNADNRLKKAKFFIPDPWTKTKMSGNFIVRGISDAISKSVNENSKGSSSLSIILKLLLGVLFYVPFSKYVFYFKMFTKRKMTGVKAIILDSLLIDVFSSLKNKTKPDFSYLFLNSGAHIQHHYLFNSSAYKGDLKNPEWYCPKEEDPLLEVLKIYDVLIGNLLIKKEKFIIATGLHQQPHKDLTYYWRLNKHKDFMNLIGLNYYDNLLPRMSRDFLISFKNEDDSSKAQKLLESIKLKRDKLHFFKVDNRGRSLFVELSYPNNLFKLDEVYSNLSNTVVKKIKSYISFVAIKNGEHNGVGYLVANFDLKLDKTKIDLTDVRGIIENSIIR